MTRWMAQERRCMSGSLLVREYHLALLGLGSGVRSRSVFSWEVCTVHSSKIFSASWASVSLEYFQLDLENPSMERLGTAESDGIVAARLGVFFGGFLRSLLVRSQDGY
jgi:hypothetical protein